MSRGPLAFALALAFLVVPSAHALDPQRAATQYVLTKWGAGLPSTTIHAVLQARDRHLWLGTTVGLVRFDGAGFVLFDAQNTPGFEDGGVSCLAEGADGTLFLGTTAGTVLQYKDGAFSRVPAPVGTSFVSALLAGRSGDLWISVPGHDTVRFREGAIVHFRALHGVQGPLALAEAPDGRSLWIGSLNGLLRFEAGVLTPMPWAKDRIQALRFDRHGALWIGTPHGLLWLHEGRHRQLTRADGLSSDDISAILEDRDGNLWVGTKGGGLNRLTSGRWSRLTTHEGLSDDDVRALFEDHEGNVWVGTADGLNSLSDGRFITYGRLEGLRDPAVSAMAPAANGGVWLGFGSGRIARLHDGAVDEYHLPAGVGREAALALHEARDGSLWIAQDNARVFRLRDGRVSEHTPIGVPEERKVRAISEDAEGPLFWVSVLGPARLRERRLVPVAPAAPPRGRFLRFPHAVYDDGRGTAWICDLYGLARVRDGRWRIFTTSDGLPHNRVRSASLEPDGSAWVATAGGLAHVGADDAVRALTPRHGLPESYLRLVLDDGRGHLWLASMGRIFRLDKREVHAALRGEIPRVRPLLFDVSDGLRTTEGLLSNAPGFRDRDGRLWFATAKGASVIDPARLSTDEPAPPVTLERIVVDGRSSRVGEVPAEYPPGRGEVTIEYSALGYRAPARIRFRHRLEGLDHDWVEADAARRAYYSSLRPGRYRFLLNASNRDGVWSDEVAAVAFALRPPFYVRPSFFAAAAAALAAFGLAAHRLRVKQVRARLAAVIQERTRIARELHDTLAQGLAGVKLHIDTAMSTMGSRPDVARQSMQCARSIATSSLAEVRRSIWVLRAQAAKGEDGLASTLHDSLRQLTADSPLLSIVEVAGRPRALPVEVERNLLRIAHEAVTNAMRHAQAKTLVTELRFDDDALRLRVRDDGRGFDPSPYLGGAAGEHFGLLGIRERVHAMGGELTVWSRPNEGTEILCRLPYDCIDPMEAGPPPAEEGAA